MVLILLFLTGESRFYYCWEYAGKCRVILTLFYFDSPMPGFDPLEEHRKHKIVRYKRSTRKSLVFNKILLAFADKGFTMAYGDLIDTLDLILVSDELKHDIKHSKV